MNHDYGTVRAKEPRLLCSDTPTGKCNTPAEAIHDQVVLLAERAETLSDVVHRVLEPYTISTPALEECEDNKEEEFPPYFARLRDMMRSIDRSLRDIRAALDRTGL